MNTNETQVTRSMVKAMVKDILNKAALYTIFATAGIIISGAVWVGNIQTKVSDLEEYENNKDEIRGQQLLINAKLDFIIDKIEDIEQGLKENTQADALYRKESQKNIMELYKSKK